MSPLRETQNQKPVTTSKVTPQQTQVKEKKHSFTRQRFAYFGFVLSILLVGIGAGLYHLGAGFFAAGLLLSIFSWLLGNE